MHGSTQASTPQLPNPNTVSSSISTVQAPLPNNLGLASSAPEFTLLESSAVQVPTMSQPSDPDTPASQPVGEVSLSSPLLVSEQLASPAQPSAAPHPSLQLSDTSSSQNGLSTASATVSPSSAPHTVPTATLQSCASPLPLAEQPATVEKSVGSRSMQFQAAFTSFNTEQQILRETVFNFGHSASPVNGKSSNAPPFVSQGAQPSFPDRGERKDTKLEDSTASDKVQLNEEEQSTKQTSGESTASVKSASPANNAQPDPIGKSGSAQSTSHASSSSKMSKPSGDTTQVQQRGSAQPVKKVSAPITAQSSKAASGKEVRWNFSRCRLKANEIGSSLPLPAHPFPGLVTPLLTVMASLLSPAHLLLLPVLPTVPTVIASLLLLARLLLYPTLPTALTVMADLTVLLLAHPLLHLLISPASTVIVSLLSKAISMHLFNRPILVTLLISADSACC